MASLSKTDGSAYGTTAIASSAAAWTNTFRIQTADGLEVTAYGFSAGIYSDYIYVTGFDFSSVPVGATITGIGATVNRRGVNFKDYSLKLIKGGTIQGNNKADTLTNYPASAANASYGGDGDLWGLTLTDTDVKASNFGLALAVQQTAGGYNEAYADYLGLTVYYGSGGGGSSSPPGHAFNNGSGYSGNRRAFVAGGLNLGGF